MTLVSRPACLFLKLHKSQLATFKQLRQIQAKMLLSPVTLESCIRMREHIKTQHIIYSLNVIHMLTVTQRTILAFLLELKVKLYFDSPMLIISYPSGDLDVSKEFTEFQMLQ